MFSNPSGNEVPACEGIDPLGSKISTVRRAKLSKRNYLLEELYPTNYPTGRIIQEELSENYGGSSCWSELFPPPAALKWQEKKKRGDKDVVERDSVV